MDKNFTPLATNSKLDNSSIEKLVKKVIKVLINFIFGFILFLLGIFFILTSLLGLKNPFLYTIQLLKPGSYLVLSGWIELAKEYFIGVSGIIMGNFVLFSGVKFFFQKKGGFKLLLFALLVLILNFFLAIIYYTVLKLK